MEETVIVALGALGAWLLVAGPVYQAALELRDQGIQDRHQLNDGNVQPPGMSPWWWLLPPIAYWKHHREHEQQRRKMLAELAPEQLKQMLDFSNKAFGWLLVASGAFFIAMKETWDLGERLDWAQPLIWSLIAAATFTALANAAFQMLRTGALLLAEGEGGGRRGALRAQRSHN